MTISDVKKPIVKLSKVIDRAVKYNPPPELEWLYGPYYSPYYSLMYLLARQIKAGLLVELGVHTGRGLASLAAGNPSNIVIGFDTVKRAELDEIVRRYNNVVFFNEPSLPVSMAISQHPRPISLLHIDTEHSYATAKAEFEAYEPYLADGAYVLFDDTHAQNDGVLKYFDGLPYFKICDDRLHPTCGYGVLIYE